MCGICIHPLIGPAKNKFHKKLLYQQRRSKPGVEPKPGKKYSSTFMVEEKPEPGEIEG